MQVKEVLKVKGNTLFSATPDMHLSDAVISMADHDIGSLVVMEGGKLVGMLTFREVINILARRQKERRVGKTPPIADILVGEAMQPEPLTSYPEMDVDELRRMMVQNHVRYVPIMEGDVLQGVISFHDVAKTVLEEKNFENRMLKAYIKDWPEQEEE
jgi:CBS domain-containing protein